MNSANYISVSQFQAWNPELDFSNYTDTTISGMIQRASAYADNYLEYSLQQETLTREQNQGMVDTNGNLLIFVKKRPVTSVSEIRIKLGTAASSLSLVDGNGENRYDIPDDGAYVMVPYQNVAITGTVTITDFYALRGINFFTQITYVAGYTTIPTDIQDAVNLLTKDIFIRQANPMDLQSMSQGSINMNFRTRTDGKSDMVIDAERMLNRYKRFTPA